MPPRIGPNVAWQIVDGEAIVVDLQSGKTIGLNATGTFLWSRLDGSSDAVALAAALVAEFDVTDEAAETDTNAFLAEMTQRGLIADAESAP